MTEAKPDDGRVPDYAQLGMRRRNTKLPAKMYTPAMAFTRMFQRQLKHWRAEAPTYEVQDRIQIHNILCLSIIREATEALDCCDWKLHRRKGERSREALLEELIDVFKFLLCLMIHHGFTEREIVEMFHHKSRKVEGRARMARLRETK